MEKVSISLVHSKMTLDTQFLLKMDFLRYELTQHPKIELIECKNPVIQENDPEADIKVYQAIEDCISNTDLLIVVATHESTELGIEIGIANQYTRKTLVCFDASVINKPKMVTGSRVNNPNLTIVEYSSEKELLGKIIEHAVVKI